jgi:hypothetical protein
MLHVTYHPFQKNHPRPLLSTPKYYPTVAPWSTPYFSGQGHIILLLINCPTKTRGLLTLWQKRARPYYSFVNKLSDKNAWSLTLWQKRVADPHDFCVYTLLSPHPLPLCSRSSQFAVCILSFLPPPPLPLLAGRPIQCAGDGAERLHRHGATGALSNMCTGQYVFEPCSRDRSTCGADSPARPKSHIPSGCHCCLAPLSPTWSPSRGAAML